MTYLPGSEATELATKADIAGLRTEITELKDEMKAMKEDIRHLGQALQRHGHAMLAGFITLFAAIIATGFFN